MIQLSESDYLAEGYARTCYFHPENENLCIKIGKPEVEKSHLYKEINYYKKIKNKQIATFDYPFYAMYHGVIDTNLGEGFVYDLIRNETNQEVSKTLLNYISMKKDNPIEDAVFNEALKSLKAQMIKHKVFASDLRPRNICCKLLKNGTMQMIIIDGIGHRDFFPVADWFGFFAKRKVERRFQSIHINTIDDHRQLLKRLYPNWSY